MFRSCLIRVTVAASRREGVGDERVKRYTATVTSVITSQRLGNIIFYSNLQLVTRGEKTSPLHQWHVRKAARCRLMPNSNAVHSLCGAFIANPNPPWFPRYQTVRSEMIQIARMKCLHFFSYFFPCWCLFNRNFLHIFQFFVSFAAILFRRNQKNRDRDKYLFF